jgi:hypothetical protein
LTRLWLFALTVAGHLDNLPGVTSKTSRCGLVADCSFYSNVMPDLMVQIVRFTDRNWPGWVECEFVDAEGRRHLIIEKVPVVTAEDLDPDSEYPRPGTVRCEILKRYRNEREQQFVCISTDRPDGIESTGGLSEFTVPASLITSLED